MAKRANRNVYDGKIPTSHDFDPSGIRSALAKALLTAIAADITRNAAARVKTLIEHRPLDYLKLVVALLPKEFRLKEVDLQDITDQELAMILTACRAAMAEQEKQGGGGGAGGQEPGGERH